MSLRLRLSKRGADKPSSGGPLLIVITIIIVFYILFLPPEVRDQLLGESTTGGTGTTGGTTSQPLRDNEFTFKGPGKMSEQTQNEYEHNIGAFQLVSSQYATVVHSENDFIVSSTLFSRRDKRIVFSIVDKETTSDLLLTYNARSADGILLVTLNGQQIFEGAVVTFNAQPLKLNSAQIVAGQNELVFSVQAPTFQFWDKNQYTITQLQISATLDDRTQLRSKQIFEIRSVEIEKLDSAKLRYNVECRGSAGRISAKLNGQALFDKIPDCGSLNVELIPKTLLQDGQNTLEFSALDGSYLIDRVQVTTTLETDEGQTYYFTVDDAYFFEEAETKAVCGEIDGICPQNCIDDVDRDCCFDKNVRAHWCDVPTDQDSDRCQSVVKDYNVNRCPSGYEDESGDVPDEYEGMCGDDNDGKCPSGCPLAYDEDCCLKKDSDRFWCANYPTGGVDFICRSSLTVEQCRFCPGGYEGEDITPVCEYESSVDINDEYELKSEYKVTLVVRFVDEVTKKQMDVTVNDKKFVIDTRESVYERDISRYVEPENNYVQLIALSDLTLLEVKVKVQKRT